jgi:hypothetical protein
MMRIVTSVLLILALAAPASAGTVSLQAQSPIWEFLRQLQQLYWQLWGWVSGQLDEATDKVREGISPVLDTVYAAKALAQWVADMARYMPGDFRYLLERAVSRLRTPPSPRRGTPRYVAEQVVKAQPAGPVAERAQALDRLTAENTVAANKVRAAQQANEQAAAAVIGDRAPEASAAAAQKAARDLAARAQNTPSTRAAVQLLVEAFAAQMDLQARYHLDLAARLGALVQQQVTLGQQLTTSTERLAAAVELLNEQQKQQLVEQTTAAVATLQQNSSAMEAVVRAAAAMRDRSGEATLYDALRGLAQRRP